jgi:hypothetical protein
MDEFAYDFFASLAKNCTTRLGDYISTWKVLHCTDRFWSRLYDLCGNAVGMSAWTKTDSCGPVHSIGLNPATGKRTWVPPEHRLDLPFFREFGQTFSLELARELAPFDVHIFLHTSLPSPLSQSVITDLQEIPDDAVRAFYPHLLCAQFSFGAMCTVTGRLMPKWDPADMATWPAFFPFMSYVADMTVEGFVARYINRPGPQADQIDV